MPIVGLPAMRRGSLIFVTRPCTVVPIGITVLPLSMTASVTRPEKGSPSLLENVERLFCSLTLSEVPAGNDILVCATAAAANNIKQSSTTYFFISLLNSAESCVRFSLGPHLVDHQFFNFLTASITCSIGARSVWLSPR